MAHLTIGEVARRTQIRASTLRYYEHKGLLPIPRRIHGQRRYDEDIVQQVAVIKLAQQAGFTIAEIGMLLHSFPADTPLSARWHVLAQQKLGEIEARLIRLQTMKHLLEAGIQCGCTQLSECDLCQHM
jgi:MerR family redox-sensitive transcriptional activator SoxR